MPRWIELPEHSFALKGVGTYEWRVAEDELRWSRHLLDIYGLTTPPASEWGFTSLVHPEDRVRVEAETSTFMGSGDEYEHEFRIVRPDGEIRHIHDRGVIERDSSGVVVVMRGMNVDITAKRRSGEFAQDGQAVDFQALADNINQLAWMADGTGWIYWYNKRWFDYTGATLDQMAGWGWRSVHHPDHVDRVVSRITHSFKTGELWEDVFPMRSADGEYRWFLSRAMPIKDAQGNVVRWFGTNTDVTDQRDVEQRLRESQEWFRALAESMPQLVWTAGFDGRVDYYNSRIRQYAMAQEGIWRWEDMLHPSDLGPTVEAWKAAAVDERDYQFSHRLRMADGSYRWHLSRAIPVRGEDGRDMRWIGTATDINDLREAEEHRQLLVAELDHRIKNILTLIQAIAQQTFRSDLPFARQVGDFTDRLHALAGAHDILTRENWKEVDLRDLIENAISSCGVPPERVAITGDPFRVSARASVTVSMAIYELCTNAIKYGALSTDRGRVDLTWTIAENDRSRICLMWRERNGPPVAPPSREGFGSRLIKRALAGELAGSATMRFDPAGLECVIEGRFR